MTKKDELVSIRIKKSQRKILNKLKKHSRQGFHEIIAMLLHRGGYA